MSQKKILIVDDEQHIRTSLSYIVKRMGHLPICAQNGCEAFEILLEHHRNNNPFDLIICDLQMPFLTGEELISKIKLQKIKIPILVITGVGNKESIILLMRLGCRDFIDKPFGPDEIIARIVSLLNDFSSENDENITFSQI